MDDITELWLFVGVLVETIYQHRMKLCARAGLDFEDADLEGIVSAYEKLNRLCGETMYDQGWLDSTRSSTPRDEKSGGAISTAAFFV